MLALVALAAERLDVVSVPEALGRQVDGLDVVKVLSGDREARSGAGAAQRLVAEDCGSPTSIPASPTHATESFGLDWHFVGILCPFYLQNFVCVKTRWGGRYPSRWLRELSAPPPKSLRALELRAIEASDEPGCRGKTAMWRASTASYATKLLNGEIFYTLKEAQSLVQAWRRKYNQVRPHSSLACANARSRIYCLHRTAETRPSRQRQETNTHEGPGRTAGPFVRLSPAAPRPAR